MKRWKFSEAQVALIPRQQSDRQKSTRASRCGYLWVSVFRE